MRWTRYLAALLLMVSIARGQDALRVGVAGHAFDHLGAISEQAPAAAANGATIIYASGVGGLGYDGLPQADQFARATAAASAYVKQSKAAGIQLAIGYVCATSIVKIDSFDRNWPAELRAKLTSAPSTWLQQDRDGKPLASWYGGDYRPACMNNPDWRTYEKFIVRAQLESGHDGIFFDNPTVHPQGCYCEYCMAKFGQFIDTNGSPHELRKLAIDRPKDFMRFRGTTASDFMAEMRAYARTIKPDALITCNNSLNSADAFFSQCRTYGYNIFEMSKIEDLVIVEDMESQPRTRADGSTVEYGPAYQMLRAIAHGKPLVAVTLADGDYHTPANLMRLATAEAAAHGASYLSWPTWPAEQRDKMIAAVRPEADLLREHADLLNDTKPCVDALLVLPFQRWVDSADCPELGTARALAAANVQFEVVCEEDLEKATAEHPKATVIRSGDGDPLLKLKKRVIAVEKQPRLRAIVRQKDAITIVHLLNLDVRKASSFEDKVSPAANVEIRLRCDREVKSVEALTADKDATGGVVAFKVDREGDVAIVHLTVPLVSVSTMLILK
jgi:hypothetical protein